MSLSRLWLFLAVALPTVAALIAPMSTVDLAYHLRAGAEILDTRAIPAVDTWTYTADGLPWVDQQWGAQVVFAVVERLGGWTGLVVLRAALTAVIFGSLLSIVRRRGLDGRSAALLTIVAFLVAAPAMAIRPQLLGMACFALALVLVTGRRTHPRGVWLMPVLVLVWANLHGSFFLGPAILGLAWLEDVHDRVERPHRLLLVGVVSSAAACLTPFGPWVWAYALGLSTNPEVTARITEWQPTSIRTATGLLFFGSALAVIALLARRGRPTPWPTLAWLGFFFVVGVYAERGVAWWPLAAIPAISGFLAPSSVRPARMDPAPIQRLNLVVAGAIIAASIALLPLWRPVDPVTLAPAGVLSNAPPGISAALRELAGPGARVFNPQPWGSWLGYAVPGIQLAIDSRIEFFPADVWREYEAIQAGSDGWQDRLVDAGVDFVVTDRSQTAFADRLAGAGWVEVYRDADGAVFTTE